MFSTPLTWEWHRPSNTIGTTSVGRSRKSTHLSEAYARPKLFTWWRFMAKDCYEKWFWNGKNRNYLKSHGKRWDVHGDHMSTPRFMNRSQRESCVIRLTSPKIPLAYRTGECPALKFWRRTSNTMLSWCVPVKECGFEPPRWGSFKFLKVAQDNHAIQTKAVIMDKLW